MKKQHRFAIYFTWKDGTQDTFNVTSREERDLNIRNMIARNEFTEIEWCRIYACGEYGSRKLAYLDECRATKIYDI